jgi:diguanylate cyclase (GGDEF)-like protein/PAS domain S-box-containing protein
MLDLADYSYNPAAVPMTVMGVLSLLLGVYVLLRGRGSTPGTLFFLLVLSISVWFFAFSWMYCATDPAAALQWAKVAYFGAAFMPSAIYHFAVALLHEYPGRRKTVWAAWLFSAGFSASAVGGDALVSQIYDYWWGYYPQYGWLSVPYLSFFFGMPLLALHDYWRTRQQAMPGAHKPKIRWLMIALGVFYLGSVDHVANFGIALYPFGYVPVFAFLVIVALIITRYRPAARLSPAFAASEILETMHEAVLVADLKGKLCATNRAALGLLGYSRAELLETALEAIFVPPYAAEMIPGQLVHKGKVNDQLMAWHQKTGGHVDVKVSASVVRDHDHFPVGIAYVAEDITGRKLAEETRASEERYALAVRGARDGLWDWDIKSNEVYFSLRWKNMLGYEDSELGNRPDDWFNRLHPEDSERVQSELAAHLAGRALHYESEYRMLHKDNSYRWILSCGIAERDSAGNATRLAGSHTDVTDRKMTAEQLAHQALYDPLTNLPNRTLFMNLLARSLARARRNETYLVAVLFLDLDCFKTVNDNLGHGVGDQLLISISRRMETCLRPGDTVARFGDDEFIILLDDLGETTAATLVAGRIQEKLMVPFKLGEHEVYTTASIGIALGTTGYERPDDLLRDADTAMYRAKALGKARSELFDESTHTKASSFLELEADLRRAVEREEFQVHYQPRVSLLTGKIVGVEALARWHHSQRGFIPPTEFIPIAEKTGLIAQLEQWILRTACAQSKAWHKAGHPRLCLSINCSARQFQDKNFPDLIKTVLHETSLSAHALELEITESIAMKNLDFCMNTLNALSSLNIRVSIDDFGTGYSSLAHLNRFPLHALKIDRSFIKDAPNNEQNTSIIRGIIALAHSLKLSVVAEGVETNEQLGLLTTEGCDEIQGYLFSRPVPAEMLGKLLQEGRCLPSLIKKSVVGTWH